MIIFCYYIIKYQGCELFYFIKQVDFYAVKFLPIIGGKGRKYCKLRNDFMILISCTETCTYSVVKLNS